MLLRRIVNHGLSFNLCKCETQQFFSTVSKFSVGPGNSIHNIYYFYLMQHN